MKMPAFDVATIKPSDPNSGGVSGFLSYPGGRVVVGFTTLKTLISYAFDVQSFQIAGGPPWIEKNRYDVVALPPASSESSNLKQPPEKATPSEEQRRMLQTLLVQRFDLKFHRETREGRVYLLVRGNRKLQMEDAKDKDKDPRGGVFTKPGGIADGEAFGINVSMPFLARQLAYDLQRPVVDETALKGSFDFYLEPSDPSNQDIASAIFNAMLRLGLKLKAGKGPVETIVIDSAAMPTEN
ncbi:MULTISPECIES: TIGR03435 family protein [Acidobacteriaceae]|uniref:TIGR03435 family protein n=1 Tax=Acidobacteriaceae TaxID=204434 RepID=UPI00131ADCC0|nr:MULTISPECIES: TIGR03435 family protein [Acidobacteriaceae]MDW5267160.1 TIGR03435 family protein [Edaphobacter sp.]